MPIYSWAWVNACAVTLCCQNPQKTFWGGGWNHIMQSWHYEMRQVLHLPVSVWFIWWYQSDICIKIIGLWITTSQVELIETYKVSINCISAYSVCVAVSINWQMNDKARQYRANNISCFLFSGQSEKLGEEPPWIVHKQRRARTHARTHTLKAWNPRRYSHVVSWEILSRSVITT